MEGLSITIYNFQPIYAAGAEKAPCPQQKLPLFRSSMPTNQPTPLSVQINDPFFMHNGPMANTLEQIVGQRGRSARRSVILHN